MKRIGSLPKTATATFRAFLLGLGFFAGLAHAEERNYVIVSSGACSLILDDVDVKSFRILIPFAHLQKLGDSQSPVRAHSCECLLLEGESQACIVEAVTKAARRVALSKSEEALLDGKIFVVIDDASQFSGLYAALNSNLPQRRATLAWRLLHSPSQATTASAGGASSGPPGGPAPPLTPAEPGHKGDSEGGKKKNKCELEPNVCMNVANGKSSMEFELKCEGMPPILVSTEGKAGLKIGPLEVSLSAGGDKKD
jgi:hypothetical protein